MKNSNARLTKILPFAEKMLPIVAASVGVLMLLSGLPGESYAQAPNEMTYQGRLQESGAPVDGSRQIEIWLCPNGSGTGCATTGVQGVTVSSGLFKSTFSIPAGYDLTKAVYLRVDVNGAMMSPLERLTSHPYAVLASTAITLIPKAGADNIEFVDNLFIKNSSLTIIAPDGASVGTQYALKVATGTGAFDETILYVSTEGWVGIGTGQNSDGAAVGLALADDKSISLNGFGAALRMGTGAGLGWGPNVGIEGSADNGSGEPNLIRFNVDVATPVYMSSATFAVGSAAPPDDTAFWLQGGRDQFYQLRVSSQNATGDIFVVQADGNVGIGTSAPGYGLDVRSPSVAASIAQFTRRGSADGLILKTYGSRSGITSATSIPLSFETGNVEHMRIQTNGNVGIGTTVPFSTVTVRGAIGWQEIGAPPDCTALTGTDKAVMYYDSGAKSLMSCVNGGGFSAVGGGLGGGGSLNQVPRFTPDGATLGNSAITSDASGRVGVNKTIPGTVLHVKGLATADALRLEPLGLSDDMDLRFTDSLAVDQWFIHRDGGAGDLFIYPSAATRDLILQTNEAGAALGNVGIGVANPTAMIDVAKSVVDVNPAARVAYTGTSNNSMVLDLSANSGGGGSGTLIKADATGVGGALPEFIVTHDGQVGIGVSVPDANARFHQQGAGAIQQHLLVDSNLHLRRTGFGEWRIRETATTGLLFDQVTNDAGGSINLARLELGDAGQVLIGQDAGTGATGGLLIVRSTSTSPDHPIISALDNAGMDVLAAFQNGNVGIGTTAPANELSVSGDSDILGSLLVASAGTIPGGTDLLISTDAAELRIDSFGLSELTFFKFGVHQASVTVGSAGNMEFAVGGGAPDLLIQPNGNIGIGVTNPSARLHVSSANAASLDTVFKVSTTTNQGDYQFVVNGAGRVGIGVANPAHSLSVGGDVKLTSSMTVVAMTLPAASATGEGALAFNTASSHFEVSENGGGWLRVGLDPQVLPKACTTSACTATANCTLGRVITFAVSADNSILACASPTFQTNTNQFIRPDCFGNATCAQMSSASAACVRVVCQ